MRLILGFVLFGMSLPVFGEEYVCNARTKSSDSGVSYSIERKGEDFLLTRAMLLDEKGFEEPGLDTTKDRYRKPAKMERFPKNFVNRYYVESEDYLSLNVLNVLGLYTFLISKKDMRFESTSLFGKDLEPVPEHGFCFLK